MQTLAELNSQITTKVELITPELARELLGYNKHNRKITVRAVDVLKKAILNNEWQVSGQTLIIDTNGELADGQHRLQAIIASDTAIFMNVCRGVKPSVFKVIDIGKNRTGADVLSINGLEASKSLKIATIIKNFNAYKLQQLASSPKMSNSEVITEYEENSNMYLSALEDSELYGSNSDLMLNSSHWALFILAMNTVIKGDEYIDKLIENELPQISSAVRKARENSSGREANNRVYVALFAGYGYFIRGKALPTAINTLHQTAKKSNGRSKVADILYPNKDL